MIVNACEVFCGVTAKHLLNVACRHTTTPRFVIPGGSIKLDKDYVQMQSTSGDTIVAFGNDSDGDGDSDNGDGDSDYGNSALHEQLKSQEPGSEMLNLLDRYGDINRMCEIVKKYNEKQTYSSALISDLRFVAGYGLTVDEVYKVDKYMLREACTILNSICNNNQTIYTLMKDDLLYTFLDLYTITIGIMGEEWAKKALLTPQVILLSESEFGKSLVFNEDEKQLLRDAMTNYAACMETKMGKIDHVYR